MYDPGFQDKSMVAVCNCLASTAGRWRSLTVEEMLGCLWLKYLPLNYPLPILEHLSLVECDLPEPLIDQYMDIPGLCLNAPRLRSFQHGSSNPFPENSVFPWAQITSFTLVITCSLNYNYLKVLAQAVHITTLRIMDPASLSFKEDMEPFILPCVVDCTVLSPTPFCPTCSYPSSKSFAWSELIRIPSLLSLEMKPTT